MVKILQINITANWGSHGKIAEGIGLQVLNEGWDSYIAYGRWKNPSCSKLYHIGNNLDETIHGFCTRIFDNHGLMSKRPTRKLISYINSISPDIIHLHNIHGYYLSYPLLFDFLKESKIPVVWTLHDCWAFTGHCAHYMFVDCHKWEKHCDSCPLKYNYPKSMGYDRSYKNFEEKKKYFLSLNNLTLIAVSKWLENDLHKSFFKEKKIIQIYNGIDINKFKPSSYSNKTLDYYHISKNKWIILGIASNWYRKGLADFIALRSMLNDNYSIVLIGLNDKELKNLPEGIIGIKRTENQNVLIDLYNAANLYFNPTWEDNFPTTNLEAMACGTPVITYCTGGSPEVIIDNTGYIVKKGDLKTAQEYIKNICEKGKRHFINPCREMIIKNFDSQRQFHKYINLYKDLLNREQ
jgi:putative colanic acid biosynthesis glycosyltransferase